MIVSPYCSRQRQTRSTNASRPISSRLVPSLASSLLDLRLGRDAGVVGAEDPLRPLAAHAGVADQRVLDRAVERVPHVQRAGDVRRRDRDRVVLRRRALGLGVEATGFEPAREDARLALTGVVACSVLEAHRAGSLRRPGRERREEESDARGHLTGHPATRDCGPGGVYGVRHADGARLTRRDRSVDVTNIPRTPYRLAPQIWMSGAHPAEDDLAPTPVTPQSPAHAETLTLDPGARACRAAQVERRRCSGRGGGRNRPARPSPRCLRSGRARRAGSRGSVTPR